ncbi:hypothetical protein Hanom_Chr09g00828541 [Helianthus anomalus]
MLSHCCCNHTFPTLNYFISKLTFIKRNPYQFLKANLDHVQDGRMGEPLSGGSNILFFLYILYI